MPTPALSRKAISCIADDHPPLADGPPAAGRNAWPTSGKRVWRPAEYNTLSIPLHR